MKLIDKSDLVAEIKRRRDAALMRQRNLEAIGQETCHNEMIANELNRVLQYANTLVVKEVDLEKEIEMIRKYYFVNNDFDKTEIDGRNITNIAKHFYLLGLAQKGENNG